MAGVVVLAFALVVLGGLYALLSPNDTAEATTAQSTQVEDGRRLFAVNCSTCHGLAAEGTENGPTLIGVGAAAVDFQVGTGRMPAQQPGPQFPRKEKAFSDEEIESLAAYVASLGPGPAVPAEEYLDVSEGDVAAGGELFRTNCASCHNATGQGGALTEGKYAPKLEGVEPRHIYEAMLTGPQNMPKFSEAVVTPENKRDIIAYLKHTEEQTDPGGLRIGRIGPVSEGLYAWIVGIGGLVVAAVWITSRGVRASRPGQTKRGANS